MTRLTPGGSEDQASPITYHQEVVVEEEVVEEEAVILGIKTIEELDKS